MKTSLFLLVIIFTLMSCTGAPERNSQSATNTSSTKTNGRYSVDQDYSPDALLDPSKIQDAIPREEYVTKAGNKSPYTVLGKTYTVLPTAKGYHEEGGASWYGLKFHGFKTSNGETYDVYQMTAAHKTLPIPCYVKVTNLQNNRAVIVRVNDRGPFHDNRIIDLSYAAATKLGMISTGTAQVRVEAIDPKNWQSNTGYEAITPIDLSSGVVETSSNNSAPVSSNNYATTATAPVNSYGKPAPVGYLYLQVGAYLDRAIALEVFTKLKPNYPKLIQLESGRDQYYRIKIGPVTDQDIDSISQDLIERGYPKPVRVK